MMSLLACHKVFYKLGNFILETVYALGQSFLIFSRHLTSNTANRFLAGFIIACMINACKTSEGPYLPPRDSNLDSLATYQKFCGACHLVPGIELADKKTWAQHILPNMGCRLGVKTNYYDPLQSMDMLDQLLVIQAKVYPEKPLISEGDWQKIKDYVQVHAPDSLVIDSIQSLPLNLFNIVPLGSLAGSPTITMLNFNPDLRYFKIGQESGKILTFDPAWKLKDSLDIRSTPLDYALGEDQSELILSVGRMYPSEQKLGTLLKVHESHIDTLLRNLHRPVHTLYLDLNGDHHKEVIISEFGYETGALSWYNLHNTKPNRRPNLLSSKPGAIKTLMEDMDGDGIADLVSLIAQGDEHVSIFKMKPGGIDKELRVLRFPPIHGVCDLDLVDFNQDGRMDIVISNGDNADYSQINKPYHGITVYLNQGNLEFRKSLFLPYPGILHTIIRDFDQDGDLDFAAVSFFPGDRKTQVPPFVYFEQQDGRFTAHSFKEAFFGKWMTLISGDFDSDGDEDLLMGSFLLNNFLVEGGPDQWKNYSLILLNNNLK